uniref:HIG1 domain-containing protein n=1 Tax=Globisporangium ultimum (strain ATCC 200006 / CBS 805.95 / DAOM BR144) TaxID=431595 RepID=K3WXT4_GLOUD
MQTSSSAIAAPTSARDIITMYACTSGLKVGTFASLVVGSGVYTANTYSQAFRTRLGVSGKWGLVVSSFLGTFTIDKALVAGTRNPEKYIAALNSNYVGEKKMHSQLKAHQRFANYLYDHPYRTLAVVGVSLVGGIFAYQSTNHAIARSQQIMHTRIYGQGAVVLLLLGSMAFHDYMAKRGRFEEVDGDDDKSLAEF